MKYKEREKQCGYVCMNSSMHQSLIIFAKFQEVNKLQTR